MKIGKQTRLWLFLLTTLAVGACTSEKSAKDSTSATEPESSDDDDDDAKESSDSTSAEAKRKPSKPSAKDTDETDDEKPPVATDVAKSAECEAYCDKKKECGSSCYPDDCAIKKGQCEASTRDYLDCVTTTGDWQCGTDGFGIVHSCKYDTSLCD